MLRQVSGIEVRAERISDPVERLRYLRSAMSSRERRSKLARAASQSGAVILAALLAMAPASRSKTAPAARAISHANSAPAVTKSERVWLVERNGTAELYSNGLRIDRSQQISNRPRANYPVFGTEWPHDIVRSSGAPAGIVYHTTESLIAPFEEDQNRRLRELGRNVLDVIRKERAYHYLIDRFGRVFAAVAESDAANHAGNSVWGDADGIYVNLNDSFLGVAFEAQTGASEQVTPAQIASAKLLTAMLRSRYAIAAEDCVTHAQVSVNPDNMKIGEHTDWSSDFPFAAVGLPDNYTVAPASMVAFGFEYDPLFIQMTHGKWQGLDVADARLAQYARDEQIAATHYRAQLRHRYKEIASALKAAEAGEAAQ